MLLLHYNSEHSSWKNFFPYRAAMPTVHVPRMGWAEKNKTKEKIAEALDSNSQYQHTLSNLSVLRRQIQFNSAEADWMSGDVLSWSSRNLAIWKLILSLKCSVVCQSSEVFHNMLWLEAQAAFTFWFDKDSKELQLIESDWVGFFVIIFFSLLKPQ